MKRDYLKRVLSSIFALLLAITLFSCTTKEQMSATQYKPLEVVSVSDKLTKIYLEKYIGLTTIKNGRQLGGYKTKDGKTVKNNLLVRCGHLAKLSDAEAMILKDEFNIKEIIDFRTKAEMTNSFDKDIEGANYQKIEIIEEPGADDPVVKNLKNITKDHSSNMMISYYENLGTIDDMYRGIVTSDIAFAGYRKFFDILLKNDGGTIFHCSSGKDRTGFAAAYLLYALGVDMETIIDDYEASNVYYASAMENVVEPLVQNNYTEDDIREIANLIGVSREAFVNALDIINEDYGGMDNYLHNQIGLTDSDINKLRERYLE